MAHFLQAAFLLLLVAVQSAFAQLAPPAWGSAQALTSTDPVGFTGQAVDAQGNTYVTGSFTNTITLTPGTVFTSRGSSDGFIAKYSPVGGLLWALQAGGPGYDRPAGLALDAAGNLHLVGNFAGSVQVGTQSVFFGGTAPHFYLATITPQGVVSGLRQDGQPIITTNTGADASASDIGVDAAGNEYVAGYFSGGPVSFGGISLTGSSTAGIRLDYFVVKYSAGTPTAQWVRPGGRVPQVTGQIFYTPSLLVSSAGEAYLVGTFAAGTGTFGTLPAPVELGNFDIGVVKYSAQGVEQWTNRSGGAGMDQARHATLDGNGHLVVTGSFSGTASFGGQALVGGATSSGGLFLYDALTGAPQWARTLTATATASYADVVADADGNFYVVGTFAGTGAAGGAALTSAGGTDAVAVSYSPQGTFRWQQQSGGTSNETAFSIRLDNARYLHVAGSFIGTAQLGSTTLVGQSSINVNVLLARLAALPLAARPPQAAYLLSIFPNPARGEIQLPALPTGAQIVLTDALGRIVHETPAGSLLSLAGLAPGLYQLMATAPNGYRWSSKLQVE